MSKIQAVEQPANRVADSEGRFALLRAKPGKTVGKWVMCLRSSVPGLVLVEHPAVRVIRYHDETDYVIDTHYLLMAESGVIFPAGIFEWSTKQAAGNAASAIAGALPDVDWYSVTRLTGDQAARASEAARSADSDGI